MRYSVKTVTVPTPPPMTPERLSRGKQLYAEAECLACHGERGRGDGPSAPTLKDNRDLPIARVLAKADPASLLAVAEAAAP